MTLENQVTSLELSKRLKELGVKQDSIFHWMLLPQEKDWSIRFNNDNTNFSILTTREWEIACETSIPAFTVAELGEMLHTDTEDNLFPYYCSTKSPSRSDERRDWQCFEGTNWVKSKHIDGANTEADSRAKMLIHLIENKLITL